ncbi:MAG: hypothetical protein AAF432_10620 [Planctomycetota bacterium]
MHDSAIGSSKSLSFDAVLVNVLLAAFVLIQLWINDLAGRGVFYDYTEVYGVPIAFWTALAATMLVHTLICIWSGRAFTWMIVIRLALVGVGAVLAWSNIIAMWNAI